MISNWYQHSVIIFVLWKRKLVGLLVLDKVVWNLIMRVIEKKVLGFFQWLRVMQWIGNVSVSQWSQMSKSRW